MNICASQKYDLVHLHAWNDENTSMLPNENLQNEKQRRKTRNSPEMLMNHLGSFKQWISLHQKTL